MRYFYGVVYPVNNGTNDETLFDYIDNMIDDMTTRQHFTVVVYVNEYFDKYHPGFARIFKIVQEGYV